jgi:hypothetical protein
MRFLTPILLFGLLPVGASTSHGQAALPPLSFLGFEAGARLDAVTLQVQALGGTGLRCDHSRRDRSVSECRATLFDPVWSRPVALWLSAMDSASGILTLSGPVTGEQLDGWKTELESAFGGVGAWVQGPQWMLQWVRQGRMMRLTWRVDNNAKVASVSLVDGWILDDWGRRRDQLPVTVDPRPARDTTRLRAARPVKPVEPAPMIETPSPR